MLMVSCSACSGIASAVSLASNCLLQPCCHLFHCLGQLNARNQLGLLTLRQRNSCFQQFNSFLYRIYLFLNGFRMASGICAIAVIILFPG
jgi:hypothetical protein